MSTKPGTRKHTITAAKRRKVIELAEAGKGRNDIAREAGVALGTVSKIVHDAGLSFDRTATKHATEAKKADNAARRATLASVLLDKATALLAEMDSTSYDVYNFGGKDNTFAQRTLTAVPTDAKKSLMQTASIALQRHMDLEKHDSDEKAGDARSMLTQLGKALGVQPVDPA